MNKYHVSITICECAPQTARVRVERQVRPETEHEGEKLPALFNIVCVIPSVGKDEAEKLKEKLEQ